MQERCNSIALQLRLSWTNQLICVIAASVCVLFEIVQAQISYTILDILHLFMSDWMFCIYLRVKHLEKLILVIIACSLYMRIAFKLNEDILWFEFVCVQLLYHISMRIESVTALKNEEYMLNISFKTHAIMSLRNNFHTIVLVLLHYGMNDMAKIFKWNVLHFCHYLNNIYFKKFNL